MKKLALTVASLLTINAVIAAPIIEIGTNGVNMSIPKSQVSEKYTNKQNVLIKSAEARRDKQLNVLDKQISTKEADIQRIKDNANLSKEQKKAQLDKKKNELKTLKTQVKDTKAASKKEIKLILE